jgi:thymidine phosphorylase
MSAVSPSGPSPAQAQAPNSVRARRLGIDTQYEAVVFMQKDCRVCRSEGFTAHTRVLLRANGRHVVATLYQIASNFVRHDEAILSESAWKRLGLADGELITVSHPAPLDSLSHVRSRIYGNDLTEPAFHAIIGDIVDGQYSDIHLSSFLTACASPPLNHQEILALTHAMVEAGERLIWPAGIVADKHSVGGLPGNRTTPIIVAIVSALGIMMPKTSSRAITSPAGTADTMETMAPVELDNDSIRHVVEREGGCVVWGGAVRLSPADDILIRVERALDLDSEGQMIASVLSKKIAAGSTHIVLDLPVGPTAKVRTPLGAQQLSEGLTSVAAEFGLKTKIVFGDGLQPIGRGIGPALEARDVLKVLRGEPDASQDLKERAVTLAAALLELAEVGALGRARAIAAEVLDSGRAWSKFQNICEAQGGMRTPPVSSQQRPVLAGRAGKIRAIDNRKIARLAKLAGAPDDKAAGVDMHVRLADAVEQGQPLCTVHAESPGELAYAFDYAAANRDIISIGEP